MERSTSCRLSIRAAGAFARVIPNGERSEYVFTLLFEPSTDPAAVATQMAVVNDELAAVRDACEAQTTDPAIKLAKAVDRQIDRG